MTTKQAAQKLGVSVVQINRLIGSGKIKAEKPGRDWIVDPDSVASYTPQPRGWKPGRPRKQNA